MRGSLRGLPSVLSLSLLGGGGVLRRRTQQSRRQSLPFHVDGTQPRHMTFSRDPKAWVHDQRWRRGKVLSSTLQSSLTVSRPNHKISRNVHPREIAMDKSAAEIYAEMVLSSQPASAPSGDRWSGGAERFREDPFRHNETLDALT